MNIQVTVQHFTILCDSFSKTPTTMLPTTKPCLEQDIEESCLNHVNVGHCDMFH